MTPIRKGTIVAAAFREVFVLALDARHPAVRWGARVIAVSWVLGGRWIALARKQGFLGPSEGPGEAAG